MKKMQITNFDKEILAVRVVSVNFPKQCFIFLKKSLTERKNRFFALIFSLC
jgi:hypothetical protein